MNNRLNFFKRLTAFLLAMLLVTTMMGNDFFSLATSDEIITEESVETGDSSSAPEAAPAPEAVDIPQEPATEEQQTPAEPEQVVEPATNEAEIPTEPQPTVDENGNPVVVPTENQPSPETPAEPKESIDDAEVTPNPENIDKPETDKTNEEDIEDPDAKDKEEGIDDEETEDEEELVKEEEEECEHEWKYVSNGNGTHFRKCTKCGEEGEQEDCDYDENGVCRKCGYEDNSLVFQTFSKEILGTTVTVEGNMPRNADVTIYYVGKKAIENIVNDSLDEGVFKAYAAYDITIYDRYGNKYQPDYDNNAVKVTFESVNKLEEVPDEEVTVFRIEDDYSVTEIAADASGEDVSFEAEHFSTYVTGTVDTNDWVEINDINQVAFIGTADTAYAYTRAAYAGFDFYADAIGDYVFTAKSYKNLTSSDNPTSGDLASESSGTYKVTVASVGWQTVKIPLVEKSVGNGYVSRGYSYSVVVAFESSPSNHVYFKFNNGSDSSTYISKGDTWKAETEHNGIFVVTTSSTNPSDYTLEVTDTPSDSYTIASVKSENDKLASENTVVYAIGETDTLTAILSEATAERTINWALDPSSSNVITLSSVSNNPMATKITAANPGSVKLNATYKGSTFSITVNVVDIKIGGDSSVEGTASHSEKYTGTNIVPTVAVNTTDAGGTVNSYYYLSDTTVKSAPNGTGAISVSSLTYPYTITRCDSATNINAGTASINIKYYYSASKVYSYDRLFTITALDVSTQNAAGKDAFDTAEFVVENGVVVDVKKVNENGVLTATPVFSDGDITVTLEGTPVFSSTGIKYTYRVVGHNNFTGQVDVVKEISGSDISQIVRAEIKTDSPLYYYEYTGKAYSLNDYVNGDNWTDLAFYDMQGNELPAGTINKNNATATINTSGTTDGDSINAGAKEIVISPTSGFSGSIVVPFTIYPRSLSEVEIHWVNGTGKFSYTGNPIEPQECTYGTTDKDFYVTLNVSGDSGDEIRIDNTNQQEYKISYLPANNHTKITDSPTLMLTATGKNFENLSTQSLGYTIQASYDLNMTVRIIDGGTYNGTYDKRDGNGYYQTGYQKYYDTTNSIPTIKVLVGGNTISLSTDYDIEVDDDASAPNGSSDLSPSVGTKYIKVTAKAGGKYEGGGTVIATYTVVPRPINSAVITVTDKTSTRDKIFNNSIWGLVIAESDADTDYDLKINYGNTYLKYGDDYTIEYSGDQVNVGTVTYTVTGKGNYTGSLPSKSFTIKPASLAENTGTAVATLDFTNPVLSLSYDGNPKYPTVNVKVNNSTFTETYKYKEATLESTNFTVSYENNTALSTTNSPAKVTVTGKNNLTGSVVLTFNITSSKDKYQISINGKAADLYSEEKFESDHYREYYCDLNAVYNGTTNYGAPVVINPATNEVLNKNGRKTDYGYAYYNTDKVNPSKPYSTATWPYLKITGINSFDGNDAIVYFKILPVSIADATINFESNNSKLDYDANNVVVPTFTITYGNTPLTLGTDYEVTCFDDEACTVPATKKAGKKYAVITGKGIYEGEVIKAYTVGVDISDALVRIIEPTDSNPAIFVPSEEERNAGTFAANNNSDASNPFKGVKWRENKAAKIELYDGATKIEPENLNAAEVTSKFKDASGGVSYVARNSKDKEDYNYNVITYTVSAKEGASKYFGSTTIYYEIQPQSIIIGNGMDWESTSSVIYYDGNAGEYRPKFVLKYGNDAYSLVGGEDYVPYPVNIGTPADYESVIDKPVYTVYGVGNFTDSYNMNNLKVERGYVIVTAKWSDDTDGSYTETTSSATTTKDLGAIYAYKENKAQCPEITLTATNGTTKLVKGTDYDITYPTEAEQKGQTKLDEDLTIKINIKGANYVAQTITITYKIASNNIKDFYGTLSDIPYTATTVDINTVKKATLKLATTKGGAELTKGIDFELVETDAETQEAKFQAQFGNTYDKAVVTESLPSYQTNYIFVKGIGIYSGYCRIPFSIILDLGNDAYTKVSMPKDSYELGDDGKPTGTEYVPTIMYRDVNGAQDTYTKQLTAPEVQVSETDGTTTTKTLTNYTITRDREGKPGPDGSIAVTGAYNCTGTAKNVQSVNAKDVCFQIRLSNYGDLAISGNGIYTYTGSAVIPAINGLIDIGAVAAPVTVNADQTITIHNGDGTDYALTYEYTDGKVTNTAIKAGKWKVNVVPTTTSRFFIPGTSKSLEFYIKYDLDNATMTFANASYDTDDPSNPPKVGYTGNPYSFTDNVTITDYDGTTEIYSKDNNALVTLNPTEKTDMGTYTITATAKDSDYCYGTCTAKFAISGISLADAAVTLEYDSKEYTGKNLAPKATVKIQNGAITLTENTDYTVKYEDNINAGTARVLISGINNYSGSITKTFTITKKDLSGCTVSFGDAYYVGNAAGLNVEPTVTVKNGTVELRSGVDYKEITSADFANNGSIATAVLNGNTEESSWTMRPSVTITATANGNYTGSITAKFTIEKLDIETNQAVNIAATSAEFTGDVIDPYEAVALSVTYKNVETPLVKYETATGNGDYSIEILDSAGNAVTSLISMGLYKMIITGKNSCTGERIIDFTVTQRSLPNNYHYYYSTEKPGFEGTWRELTTADFDTAENYKPGFVTEGGLANDKLKIYIYDCTTVKAGEDNVPEIAIIDAGVKDPDDSSKNYELIKEKDYTVTVSNAQKAGTAEWNRAATEDKHATVADTSPAITITGQGDYTGSITLPFNIGKNINNQGLKITYSVNGTDYAYDASFGTYSSTSPRWQYTYNGTAQVPVVKVTTSSDVRLSSTKDYTVSYTDGVGNDDSSINAGYKYVVITGKGDYCGTMIQRYQINRKKITAEPVIMNPKTTAAGGTYFTTEVNPYAADKTDAGTYGNPVLTFRLTGLNKLTDETAKKYLAAHGLKTDDDNNQTADYVGYYYGIYSGTAIKPEITVYDNTLGTAGTTTKQIAGGDDGDLDINYLNDNTKTLFNDDGTILRCGEVTIGFKANTNTLESTSKGNYYVGSESAKYRFRYIIVARDITSDDFVAEFVEGLDKPQDYTGSFIEPEVSVTNGGSPLVKYDESTDEGDYKLTYEDNVIPGTATVTITGVNNYTGTKTLHFDIMGNLNNDTVECSKDDNGNYIKGAPKQIYTGTSITKGNPQIYLMLEGTTDYPEDVILTYGEEYMVSGVGDTDNYVSYGTIIYSGVEAKYWKGDKSVYYDIEFNESEIHVNNNEGDYKFTGFPIVPKFTLNVSTAEIKSTKYYQNSKEIDPTADADKQYFTNNGTIDVVITYDVGNKKGNTATTQYNIVPRPIEECNVEYAKDFHRYTGNAVEPAFSISIISKNLQTDKEQIYTDLQVFDEATNTGDYTVDYGNFVYSTSEDDCYITLTGKSDKLEGTATYPYTISLQAVANLRVTENTGDSMTVKWVKDLFSDGTQLKFEVMNSDGTYKDYMVTRIAGNGNEYKLEGLKGSTTYRITATAYANPATGVTIYSDDKTIEKTTDVEKSSITVKRSSSDPTRATVTLPSDGDVVIYYIYRSTDTTSKGTLCAILPRDTGAYTNTNLNSGTTYYYYVVGYGFSSTTGKLEQVNQSEYVEAVIQ
ncbi:MAG: hypothetical protein IJ535_04430 [Pseudobutyrivibrio sp.]|uniref:fibronectin type III domain-containing protein n=1 Tax=Pseudobutyrivibrio sp. TaxID=2014367 RepID=UPI0025DCC56F|nr:hypothetical protein [Pseudobutyrivibrio sp.]MBQ8489010.1 hypothetical protein [Pseudobutyrivibrio sp.]